MKPVRTASSNLVYRGPTPDIGDLHCERIQPGVIRAVWWFTPAEREAIADGANLSLTVLGEPIPPVSVEVTTDAGVGEDAPDVLFRLDRLTNPCSCGGRRWVVDENWTPEYPKEWDGKRSPRDGLIPCGFCNPGGWDVELDEPETGR